jgi:Glycosyltransferase family 87
MPYRYLYLGFALTIGTAWLVYLELPVASIAVLLGWFGGLSAWFYGYRTLLRQQSSLANEAQESIQPFIIPLLLFACMPPILSKDVFIYLLQGKLALNGIFTYTDGSFNTHHEWVEYVDPIWRDCPNHYGPLPMVLFVLAALSKSIVGALVALKVMYSLLAFAILYAARQLARALGVNPNKVALAIGLNPIFLIQGVGQLHIDLLVCLLLLLFLFSLTRPHHWWITGMSIGCLGLTKTLLLPLSLGFYVLFVLWHWKNDRFNFFEAVKTISVTVILMIVGYATLGQPPEALTHPISYHAQKEPVKSVTELASYVGVYLFPQANSTSIQSSLVDQKIAMAHKITPIVQIIALLLALWVAYRTFLGKQLLGFIFGIGLMMHIVFILYSPIMHPWYFLLIMPFFALFTDEKPIVSILTATFILSCTYEIGACIGGSLGQTVTVAGTIVSVLAYWVGFKKCLTHQYSYA